MSGQPVQRRKPPPVTKTPAQIRAAAKVDLGAKRDAEAELAATREREAADRLAQIVNLTIAGHTPASIGAATGHTAAEIERMLTEDASRFVRAQPALRGWVRNWIAEKYTTMIEADWDQARDPMASQKLENQAAVIKMLTGMERLFGAAAPTQSEVKIDAAPEAIESMINALAKQRGLGYDEDIFDVEFTEDDDVRAAPGQALAALEESARVVEEPQEGDV